jgi:hypothetical protein
MLTLPRNDKRGAKRKRPRIEELIKISIQDIVTHKPRARSQVIDGKGNWFEFVDEIVGSEQRLSIYINGERSLISFPLVDAPICGRIKNPVPWDRNRVYYVMVQGKLYRALYIDPINKRIGSRDSLNAIYTCDSVGQKQERFWRDLQRLRKRPLCSAEW